MKKSFFTKLLSFFLLISLILCLFSCVGDGGEESGADKSGESEETTSSEHKTAKEWINTLADTDAYEGKTFVIATTNADLFQGEGETLINKAVARRNALVEDKYGINIEVKTVANSELLINALRVNEASGTKYADLVCADSDSLATLIEKGCLMNLYSLPFLDFSADYMKIPLIEAQTLNNSLYSVSSGLTMDTKDVWAVYYDKELLSSKGIDPISYVEDGSWSWDKLIDSVKTVCADTLKKSSHDTAKDVFGVASYYDSDELRNAVWASSGKKFFGSSKESAPTLNISDGEATPITAMAVKLLKEGLIYDYDGQRALTAFTEGRIAFFIYKLDMVFKLENTTREWGILPLPKLSAAQSDYYSWLDGGASAVAIPASVDDSEFCGVILNALFAASVDTIDEALQSAYINYYFWGNDASKMLKLISQNVYFDPAFAFSGVPALSAVSIDAYKAAVEDGKDFSSALTESKRSAFENYSQKFFK